MAESWCKELWKKNVAYLGDRPAVIDRGRRLTHAELASRANRLYWALRSRGLEKGERVAILAYNCAEYLEWMQACEKGGFVGVPVNWRLSADNVAFVLDNSESKILLLHEDFVEPVSSIRPQLRNLEHLLVFDATSPPAIGEAYEEALATADSREPEVQMEDEDPAYIIYSSGTTGRPKGVVFTHHMQLESAKAHVTELGLTPQDVALVVMPLFHSGGHATASAIAYVGGINVLLPRFEARTVLEVLEQERVTFVQVVPTMIAALLEQPDLHRYRLDNLKTIQYVGAPMPQSLLEKAARFFGAHRFIQNYGLTENGPLVSTLSREDHLAGLREGASETARKRLGSVGRPHYGLWVRIVDDRGNELPRNTIGEIAVRAETTTPGYWKQQELTRKKIRDGWLFTGDIGLMDQDGYLYLVDRKDDMIVTGGENVYPSYVENVLCRHPAVKEAAVVGLPDEKWGEMVTAAVALWPETVATEEELLEHCKPHLAGYERPKRVVILQELPKSPTGKILRREVRRRLQEKAR
ncbi:MAG: long-chain-fatty-acid--CoA ligase [Clostridia bacterium]|nr:long-chain-fatty-acid--CoA ligase [Clostridia bacterium]MDH7572949.1 long-chain-fatty-acid--CoA ligase [Clostridia bacterium]